MGSISIREYIQWLPDPPSENTSTLVLTSPGRRFVDIRMLRTAKGAEENEIEWAFAGASSSETRANGIKHSIWRHFVDSRTKDAEGVVDEADMFPQQQQQPEDHDGGHALEKGRMVNPDTGLETDYEEMWRDVEPLAVPSSSASAGTGGSGSGSGDGDGDGDGAKEGKVRSVVLELRDDDAGRRGLVVGLGRYCQGVVRDGDAFALEQWEWTREKEQEQEQGVAGAGAGAGAGGWRRRRRVGADLYLPCQEVIENKACLEVGHRVERDGLFWTVVEVS